VVQIRLGTLNSPTAQIFDRSAEMDERQLFLAVQSVFSGLVTQQVALPS